MDIFDSIDALLKSSRKLDNHVLKLEQSLHECDYEKLLSTAENSFVTALRAYMANRELLIALYDAIPSVPQNLYRLEQDTLQITIEQLQYSFPAFRIVLPALLPNKRKRKIDFRNAVTNSISESLIRFCKENKICPLRHATVIFVSRYGHETKIMTDSDNLESSCVINALSGVLITDDHPGVCSTHFTVKKSPDQVCSTEVYVVDYEHDLEILSIIKST